SADIIARFTSGATTAELASVYRVSKSRISAVLRDHGVTLRRQGLTEQQAREAADFYVAGRSVAWLASRYGVLTDTHWPRRSRLPKRIGQLSPTFPPLSSPSR